MDIFPGAKLLQVVEWGYFMGSYRPAPDPRLAFSVVHITANIATAENEASWRINDPALQNSATFFNNRDGSVVQLLGDPATMDPWANGDMNMPDVTNPRIAALVRDGVNPNERTLLAIENVGNEIAWGKVPGGYPITPAQEETCARQIAHYHTRNRVPINRETVVGHYQLNSVSRPNCPSRDKSILDRIVARAQRIAGIQEDYMIRQPIVTEEWTTKVGPASTFTRPDGTTGYFTAAERVRSIAEITLPGGIDARLLVYGPNHEALVIPRTGITPIAGTRVAGVPTGGTVEVIKEVVKEVPTGITQEQLNAAVTQAKAAERARIAALEAARIKSL